MSTSGTTRVVEVDGAELRAYEIAPEDVGLRARRPGGAGRRHAGRQRRDDAADLRRRARPARDLAVLNAGAAIYVSGRVDTLEEGVRAAEAAIDDGRAAAPRSDAPGASTDREELAPRMSVLDRIVDDTRDEVKRRREAGAARRAWRRRSPSAPEGAAVLGGADAPGHLADRRAQAPLAVGGRDPRGRDGRRGRAGLRARRRGRAVDPHRAVPLRRLARRPARGARGVRRCRCCARTSSSTRTSSTRRPRRAPTRSC